MTVLFAGGRLDSLQVISGTATEVTTGGTFDSAYCDASTNLNGNTAIVQALFRDAANAPVSVTSGESVWAHFDFANASYGTGTMSWLVDSSLNPWVAIRGAGTNLFGLYYNSGTGASPVWTLIGSTFTITSLQTMDLRVSLGAPHTAELYMGSTLMASGTFTQAALTELRALRIIGPSGTNARFSQILITKDRSTIGAKVRYSRPNGAGGNSQWTGALSNVNEAINNDATLDSTTVAGNRQTYAMGDVTVPANYAIVSVFHFIRGKNDGAAPGNIKSVVRQGSTNYDYADNVPGISTGYGPLPARYDNDPATGLPWTQSGFNSAEFGYLSQT